MFVNNLIELVLSLKFPLSQFLYYVFTILYRFKNSSQNHSMITLAVELGRNETLFITVFLF